MTAARKLDVDDDDPALFTFDNAPIAEEPYTDEQRAADEVGMADIRAGRCRMISREEMRAKFERMRGEQGE